MKRLLPLIALLALAGCGAASRDAAVAPTQPTNLTAVNSAKGITLSWTPAAGETSANIFRAGANYPGHAAGTPWGSTTAFSFLNEYSIEKGQHYCYYVSALTPSGESPQAGPACALAGEAAPVTTSTTSLPPLTTTTTPVATTTTASKTTTSTTSVTTVTPTGFPTKTSVGKQGCTSFHPVTVSTSETLENECLGEVKVASSAVVLTIRNSTINAGNNESAINNDQRGTVHVIGDSIYNCGECLHQGTLTVNGSFVESNASINPGTKAEDHYEGSYLTDSSITVEGSTIIDPHPQTAAIFGDTNLGSGGAADNHIIIRNSYLAGGGYTIYADSTATSAGSSVTILEGDTLGAGQYGYAAYIDCAAATWVANVSTTGTPVGCQGTLSVRLETARLRAKGH